MMRTGNVVTVTAPGNHFEGAVGRIVGEPMSDGSLYVHMFGGVGAAFYPAALSLARIPTDRYSLAALVRVDDDTNSGLYDQLRAQEGADRAAELWRSACDLNDSMAGLVDEDGE